jgi:hypothetical protein
MAEMMLKQAKGFAVPGLGMVAAKVTTTTNGTIGTKEEFQCTIVKAAGTGRYTLTLRRATRKFIGANVTLIGPDSAALTTTKGVIAIVRDDDFNSDGTIEIQFVQSNAGNADTEVQDGASFTVMVFFADSGARA